MEEHLTKEVLISLKGVQFDGPVDENSEPLEIITNGEYYLKNDTHYIRYKEPQDGDAGATKCMLKIKNHELELIKRGASNVNMVFIKDKKNMSSYGTPFGSIVIGVETNRMSLLLEADRMQVKVDYRMDVNYEFLANCSISIDVCSKEKGSVLFRS